MRLIDADELKKVIFSKSDSMEDLWDTAGVLNAINNAPTIEWKDIELMGYVNGGKITIIKPSKIEGHWITRDGYPHRIYCSICKVTFADEKWEVWKDGSLPRNYCPNCGAKMKMAVNLCDDCKFADDCNPTLKRRDGVSTSQCSKYEPYKKGADNDGK